jgi:hypothetical protein
MTDSIHLGLPFIEGAQAQKHITHNEALVILDAVVMLAAIDRDLSAPPASPAEGARYLVKPPGSGAFAGNDNQIAHYLDGGWSFYAPVKGWTCYVEDEGRLVAWDGASWQAVGGPTTELQNLVLLGIGTPADTTNPFAAKLNNALWTAKSVAEGGTGDLRYKMSKDSAAKTLSLLFQDNYSGRAEIGLTGDDDFHFKTSPDGASWVEALLLDKATGSTKVNAGFFLTGDISPPQIAADQNDYNPTGLSAATVLRLSSDAARNITGLSGGSDGRFLLVSNVGAQDLVFKNESASSSADNRFALTGDLIIASGMIALLCYDASSSRWRVAGDGGAVRWDRGQSLSSGQKDQARQNIGLPGSTTVGRLARFTGTDGSLGQSAAFHDNGAGRGSVGTTSPQATFQVVTSGAQTADTDSNNEAIITGPDHSTSASQGNLAIISNTAAAVGKGGSLVFAGMYTGSNVAAFAKIAGVQAAASFYTGVLKFYTRRADGSMTESGQFDSVGNFGVGVAPSARLHNTTSTRHDHLGAGSVQSDASGNLSTSSDERLKTIDGPFVRSIEAIRAITPIIYHWNARSGLDQLNQYVGFSAQNVQGNIPEAVGSDDQGFLTLSDRALLAAAINAIKNVDARLTAAGH